MEKNKILQVTIEDMGSAGEGIGKVDGYTLFVKDALIGDKVEARIVKAKKKYAYARLERILEPSPFRVGPKCRFARQCGGCQLQAMSYERQLTYKQDKIRASLIRIGGFREEEADAFLEPIVGMEEPYHYRNKAQYPVGTDRNGGLITGFYAGRTHDIISNTDCCLGREENREILEKLLAYMKENHVTAYDEATGKGLVRHILIRTGFDSGEIMVCLILNGCKGGNGCLGEDDLSGETVCEGKIAFEGRIDYLGETPSKNKNACLEKSACVGRTICERGYTNEGEIIYERGNTGEGEIIYERENTCEGVNDGKGETASEGEKGREGENISARGNTYEGVNDSKGETAGGGEKGREGEISYERGNTYGGVNDCKGETANGGENGCEGENISERGNTYEGVNDGKGETASEGENGREGENISERGNTCEGVNDGKGETASEGENGRKGENISEKGNTCEGVNDGKGETACGGENGCEGRNTGEGEKDFRRFESHNTKDVVRAEGQKESNHGNHDGMNEKEFLPAQGRLISILREILGMASISANFNTERTNVIMGRKTVTLWGKDKITDSLYVRDPETFERTGNKVTFRISPVSFYQVNPLQTEKLYSLALDYAGLTGKETVWDIYCGIGTISLFLAGHAGKVYGVEAVERAVEDARENARLNGIENVEFFAGKAEEILPEKYEKDGIQADVIVVDPPRKGCEEAVLQTMLRMRPERIVYVSCDPATLARDLKVLREGGYEVVKGRGVDQFGGTVHCEVCVELCRK